MAYNALNNLIDAYIYPNGVQAITGSILNNVLKAMVSQLGGGYNLMGVAAPASSPAVNDEPQAYFAATAGTYTNFDGIVLAAGEVAVLLTSGNGSWSKQTIYNVPTGTADLANTAGFITNSVNSLVNYYTKGEIDTTLGGYATNAALAAALADYYNKSAIDAQMATRYTKTEVDTKFGDYYRKTETYDKDEVDSIVAALSRQEYVVAWDGASTPDVTAIPAGVTVTYSGTTYTGTLAASASTVNKIYMVWNGVAYDMYGTSADGGFSWVPMGTTTVDLSQYATKSEVSQLEAKVDGKLTPVWRQGSLAGSSHAYNPNMSTRIIAAAMSEGTISFSIASGYYALVSWYSEAYTDPVQNTAGTGFLGDNGAWLEGEVEVPAPSGCKSITITVKHGSAGTDTILPTAGATAITNLIQVGSLNEKVEKAQEDIVEIFEKVGFDLSPIWEQGTLSYAHGYYSGNTTRIICATKANGGISFSVTSGYYALVSWFSEIYTDPVQNTLGTGFLGDNGAWLKGDVVLSSPSGCKSIMITVKHGQEGTDTILPSAGATAITKLEQLGTLEEEIKNISSENLIQGLNDNILEIRHNASTDTESSTGNRFSIVFQVREGDALITQSSFSPGINVSVWDTISHGLKAPASQTGLVQAISNYTTEKVKCVIEGDGYLIVKFKKNDDSSITDAEIAQMISSLSVSIADSSLSPFLSTEFVPDVYSEDVADIRTLKKEKSSISTETWLNAEFSAMFFSDVHRESGKLQRMVELSNEWNLFDAILNGGDSVLNHGGEENLDWYNDIVRQSNVPVLAALGNHDAWENVVTRELIAATDAYNLVIAEVAETANIVQPANAETLGLNYYYKDFSSVRVVVLDLMYWDANELSWFEGVLSDANTNGKHILCLQHAAFLAASNIENVGTVWNSFGNTAAASNYCHIPIDASNAVNTFVNNGGKFVAWICGHCHGDILRMATHGDNKQLAFSTSSITNRGASTYKSDSQNDYNYICCNAVIVDTTQKYLKVFRVGAGLDMNVKKRKAFCWDYENGTLISEW